MSWIIAIIIGGLVGWAANAILGGRRQNLFVDVIIGIVGALLSRWIFGSVLGIGTALAAGTFSLLGIIWAIIGAVILLAIIRALMPGERTGEMGPTYYEEVRRRKNRHHDDEEDK